ncbi:MAG: hypothetical protein ACNA8G_03850 [Gammaproteobacteria bacterium]
MNARKTLAILATLGMSAAYLAPAIASAQEVEDFSRLTNQELVQTRARVGEMSEAEHARFRAEMQQRARTMTQEEREALGIGGTQRRAGGQDGAGFGQGYEQREQQQVQMQTQTRARTQAQTEAQTGAQTKAQKQTRAEEGADRGQGEMTRERQRLESSRERGYGRGFESRRESGGREGGGGRRHGG